MDAVADVEVKDVEAVADVAVVLAVDSLVSLDVESADSGSSSPQPAPRMTMADRPTTASARFVLRCVVVDLVRLFIIDQSTTAPVKAEEHKVLLGATLPTAGS